MGEANVVFVVEREGGEKERGREIKVTLGGLG